MHRFSVYQVVILALLITTPVMADSQGSADNGILKSLNSLGKNKGLVGIEELPVTIVCLVTEPKTFTQRI